MKRDAPEAPVRPGGGCRGRRWFATLRRMHASRAGATMLEWVLLLAAIALPSYVIIRIGLALLQAHYQLVVTLLELPFP